MKSSITHQQYIALLDATGPVAADPMRDLGIMDADQIEQPHGPAVTEGMHGYLPVEITVPDVLDPAIGYPWLSLSEAEAVVRSLGDGVEGAYRYDQIEATLRKQDLPFEPPAGWFQWLDERRTSIWTRWTKKDQTLASTLSWTVRNYPASPTIEPINPSMCARAATDTMVKLHDRATLWREGYRNSVTRVCSRAVALIDYHSTKSDTSGHRDE